MKTAGFLLLLAGFVIVLSAFALLSSNTSRAVFTLSGIAVQLLGLILTFRAHYTLNEEH
jgi:membrane-bound ClpP family serine protease